MSAVAHPCTRAQTLQYVLVMDTIRKWMQGAVMREREGDVLIHYMGWSAKWDEWWARKGRSCAVASDARCAVHRIAKDSERIKRWVASRKFTETAGTVVKELRLAMRVCVRADVLAAAPQRRAMSVFPTTSSGGIAPVSSLRSPTAIARRA